jgi:hypothetical protein
MFSMTTRFLLIAILAVSLVGCDVEDPGPRQYAEKTFSIVDFDRLEIGSGLHIEVEQGSFYSISASGDRRNVDDLVVEKEGSTLIVRYKNSRERRYDTDIKITCPELHSVIFSGASDSKVSGFQTDGSFDVYLSGASLCQLDIDATELRAVLSGASYLNLRGEGDVMEADLSGASSLKAFRYNVKRGDIELTGASHGEVNVSEILNVVASSASHLIYQGSPSVSSELSGASSVTQR